MNDFEHKLLSMVMGVLLIVSALAIAKEAALYVASDRVEAKTKEPLPCVVIDAGHGGRDPGKVGINGALEKDLNLEIALLLKQFLEEEDVRVVMTRESDAGLYDEDASNKKVQDMKRRIALIEEAAPAVTVSIHQNSFPEEYVSGAQVFYYKDSGPGKRIAECIQKALGERIGEECVRQSKANDSYYLLKKTGMPVVIVECGFLSNAAEAEKLSDGVYQERLAWAIHIGILRYINGMNQANE